MAGPSARTATFTPMTELNGSTTHRNLIAAFNRESQASQRYSWFAQQADIDGRPDAAALFRTVADTETGHAHGALEFLIDAGDPATDMPLGATDDHLAAAAAGEDDDATATYPAFARAARDEGFDQIADWFESLARAEAGQRDRFREAAGDRG